MGCDYYPVVKDISESISHPGCADYVSLHFPEFDDDHVCLCQFSAEGAEKHGLGDFQLRSLAYIGAAVVLLRNEQIKAEDVMYLPKCLPEPLKQRIDQQASAEQLVREYFAAAKRDGHCEAGAVDVMYDAAEKLGIKRSEID